jgi:hypothetical protein
MYAQSRASVVSEFEDLLCALCVPQRSLRLNLPFNAENTENAEDAEETLQLKTPLPKESRVTRLCLKSRESHPREWVDC